MRRGSGKGDSGEWRSRSLIDDSIWESRWEWGSLRLWRWSGEEISAILIVRGKSVPGDGM